MENSYKKNSRIILIGLGGNQGDRLSNLKSAVEQLQSMFKESFCVSPVYETPAWGFESQQDFLNCCVRFESRINALELLDLCASIEDNLGRQRDLTKGYSSRTMDLDVLYVGKEVISTNDLTVPHPRLSERNFVLYPLNDIASEFVDPASGKSIERIKSECNDESGILLYTNKLLTF